MKYDSNKIMSDMATIHATQNFYAQVDSITHSDIGTGDVLSAIKKLAPDTQLILDTIFYASGKLGFPAENESAEERQKRIASRGVILILSEYLAGVEY